MFEKLKEMFGFTENTSGAVLDVEVRHYKQLNLMKFIIGALLVAIGLMGVAYTNASNERYAQIELPPSIVVQAPIKVGNGWANDMYFKVWADWMLYTTANFTPGDVKEKLNQSIRFFSHEKESEYAGQLGALSNLIIRNQLKQTFTVKKTDITLYDDVDFQEVSTDPEKVLGGVFTYKGVASQALGNSPLPDKDCTYSVAVRFEGGHLYGYSYNTDCFK